MRWKPQNSETVILKEGKKMLKLWTAIIFLCFYNCITLYGMEDQEMDDEDYADQEETVAKGLVSS